MIDNGGKWIGIYHVDPDGTEFKDTMKNLRETLEVSLEPTMPCKLRGETCSDEIRTLQGQDAPVSSKPMNPRDRTLKRLNKEIMRSCG